MPSSGAMHATRRGFEDVVISSSANFIRWRRRTVRAATTATITICSDARLGSRELAADALAQDAPPAP